MTTIQEFCLNKKIATVKIEDEGKEQVIVISFDVPNCILRLLARADCCSSSFFDFFDNKPIEIIIGKEIRSIDELDEEYSWPGGAYGDKHHLLQINFADDTTFRFILSNSSNGLYDGWLDIVFINP